MKAILRTKDGLETYDRMHIKPGEKVPTSLRRHLIKDPISIHTDRYRTYIFQGCMDGDANPIYEEWHTDDAPAFKDE